MNVIAAFPLAPSACLVMGSNGPESISVDAGQVAKVNEIVVRACDRSVYSKTLSAEIRQHVDAFAGSTKYGETAFLLPMRPSAKDFIRKVLGLDKAASVGDKV